MDRIALADVKTEAQAKVWWRQQWSDPAFVDQRIVDYQWCALAILVNHPKAAKGYEGSIFGNNNQPFLKIIKAVKLAGATQESVLQRLESDEEALMLAWDMTGYVGAQFPNWPLELAHVVCRLRKVFAWKYRQEKKRRAVA